MESLLPNEKSSIVEYAASKGYQGVSSKGEFVVGGIKTKSPNTFLRNLGLPHALETLGQYRVLNKFKLLHSEIVDTLKEIPYSPKPIEISDLSKSLFTEENSNKLKNVFIGKYDLYKTLKFNMGFDPNAKKSNGMSLIIMNPESRNILNGNSVSYDAILSLKGTARELIADDPSIPLVWPVFNPYTSELTYESTGDDFGGETIIALNTAIPPKWIGVESSPKFEGFIKKLFVHLFPNEEERELVLDWFHYAIFKRNGTVLCLAGDRGTGKSTVVEILAELVGWQYSEWVSEAVLTDKFNSQFRDKRLLIFEEVALAENKAINKIKAWCNSKISIEEKGVNAYSADNFTSMVFLMNDLGDLKIQAQERRFSIPVVAEENLLTVISEEEISEFKIGLEKKTPEFLKQISEFGNFLKEREPRFSEYTPIKGENYMRVTNLSLKEWQNIVKEYISNQGEEGVVIPISAIIPNERDKNGPIFPNRKDTIDNFLRDYRYLGKYKIADVVNLTELELDELEAKYSLGRKARPTPFSKGKKTKRLYGLKPRGEFLRQIYKERILKSGARENPVDLL